MDNTSDKICISKVNGDFTTITNPRRVAANQEGNGK